MAGFNRLLRITVNFPRNSSAETRAPPKVADDPADDVHCGLRTLGPGAVQGSVFDPLPFIGGGEVEISRTGKYFVSIVHVCLQ